MKTNPLFLSSPAVEGNLRVLYNVFYRLKTATTPNAEFDELLLLLLFPKTSRQLAHDMNISRQALHQRLLRIKDNGWLEKKSTFADRRQHLYCLNAKGEEMVKRVMTPAVKKLTAAYQQAGGEAVAGFIKVVELLYNQSDKKENG